MNSHSWPTTILAALAAVEALAAPPAYETETIVLEGETATGFGTLTILYLPITIDDDGRVVFAVGGTTSYGLASWSPGGAVVAAVAEGDFSPLPAMTAYRDLGRPRATAPGRLAWLGGIDDAGSSYGIFERDASGDALVILDGDVVPGGGTHAGGRPTGASPNGVLVVLSLVDEGGSGATALLLRPAGGVLEPLARDGDAAPAAVGGSFELPTSTSRTPIGADGSVVFHARLSGSNSAEGLFRASQGAVSVVLATGDPLPAEAGSRFTEVGAADGNAEGDLAFVGRVERPNEASALRGVYAVESGVVREVIRRGAAIPGSAPARFYLGPGGSGPPDVGGNGVVVMPSFLTDAAENVSDSALLVERDGAVVVLLAEGDAVPGHASAVIADFVEARADASGRIAIQAQTSAGTAMLLATPVPEPGALASALAALLGLALHVRLTASRTGT